jgi:L-alanine-DL-glutamate epimerase-like enolase superfamily enzyme
MCGVERQGSAALKITDVRTASVRGNFEWILVRIYSDEGLTGLGECYWGAGVETVVNRMKRLLVGEDPQNVDWLYQKMVRGMSGAGSTGGTVVAAISGVELALWDLKGKALGTPIYNLLGGRYRNRIRIYADCGHGAAPEPAAWADRAQEVVAGGFSALKFDVDNIRPDLFADRDHVGTTGRRRAWVRNQQHPISNAELDLIVDLAVAVREAVGRDVDLALDCHWNYTVRDAITLARELEPLRLRWLEDPTPPDNLDALKRVTDNSAVPICSGENRYTRHGFVGMVTSQAVDIIQPDVPKVGGLLESKKIADLADLYYIPIAAHNVSSPIGTMAACHTCAGMRNFIIMEFHCLDVEWWDDLVTAGEPLIRDGCITLPDGPGLGLELDEDVARAHLAEGAGFFE